MATSNPYTDDDDIVEEDITDVEKQRDLEVLLEMEVAASKYRAVDIPKGKPSCMSESMFTAINTLPRVLRDSAMETYTMYQVVWEHFSDTLDILEKELRELRDGRVCMTSYPPDKYHCIPPKYRNAHNRNRRVNVRRKQRLVKRIARTKEKLFYIRKNILNAHGGPPTELKPCSLCFVGGTGTLVPEREQPLCCNVDCQYVLCGTCFINLRMACKYGRSPRCPGCNEDFVMRGVNVVEKHDYSVNPFMILSDADSSDSDKNSSGEESGGKTCYLS